MVYSYPYVLLDPVAASYDLCRSAKRYIRHCKMVGFNLVQLG